MSRTGPSRRFQVIVTLVLGAMIAGLLAIEVVGARGDRGGYRGVITVTGCTYDHWIRYGSIYACTGSFRSDDGDIRQPYVTFTGNRVAAGSRLAAIVTGRADTNPKLVSESWARLAVTSGLSAILAFAVFVVWWVPRRAALDRRAGPASGS